MSIEKRSKKPKTLPKYLTKEVISDILDNAKKDRYRNYILLLTLWRTGMRVSDIVKLKKQDIQEDCIIVRMGKGKKDRMIPLESELGNILGLFTDQMKPRDLLFHIGSRQIRNIVKQHTPDELKKDIHPHTLRHSFSVHCLNSGMNIRALQKILGHSDLATTAVYLDIVGKDIKEEFKKVIW